MHVASRPINAPVALIEKQGPGGTCLRVLVFRDGLLSTPIINLLRSLLRNV